MPGLGAATHIFVATGATDMRFGFNSLYALLLLASCSKTLKAAGTFTNTHLEGILNYCRTKAKVGVVEVVNGDIKALLRWGTRQS